MGKGRKNRSFNASNSALRPASSSSQVGDGDLLAEEHSHSLPKQEEQVKPPCEAEKTTSRLNANAAPFEHKDSLAAETSSSFGKKKSTSMPLCRYFQNGYCRYGDTCRFQHSGAPAASAKPSTKMASGRAAVKDNCVPKECFEWHVTGICPRRRTCKYAHPVDCKNMKAGKDEQSGPSEAAFEYMLMEFLRHGLSGDGNERAHEEMEQRMANGGFTDDDVYELSLQGIKPWDPEAWDALAVLNGWDMDDYYSDDGFGLDECEE